MTREDWESSEARALGMLLARNAVEPATGAVLVLANGSDREVPFVLPTPMGGGAWEAVLDTARGPSHARERTHAASYALTDRSMVVLRTQRMV
jgi:hypothetical protein